MMKSCCVLQKSQKAILYMFGIGSFMMIGTLGVFVWSFLEGVWAWGTALHDGPVYVHATTMAFITIVVFQLFNVMNCRSDSKSLFHIGLWSNKKLLAAIAVSLA